MSIVNITNSVIPMVRQYISINNSVDPRIWCQSINLGSKLGETTAEFVIPESLFDSNRTYFQDAFISVEAGLDGGVTKRVFSGFLSSESSELSTSQDGGVIIKAYSITYWLSKVFLDQNIHQWVLEYYLRHPVTDMPTGWTPLKIMMDIIARIPSDYKQYIEIGDTQAIRDSTDIEISSFKFRLQSISESINQILAAFGDIALRERYVGKKCLLDFYKIGDRNAPQKYVKVASFNNPSEVGANVATLTRNNTSDEMVNRVIGYGADKRFCVSVKSNVNGLPSLSEIEPMKQLIKDWDPALEPLVLNNPKLASSDRVGCSCTCDEAAGGGTSFQIKIEMDVPVGSELISRRNGERMLVTDFAPDEDGKGGMVTVERQHKDTSPDNLVAKDELDIEIPGISNVFRKYRLPALFRGKTILKDNVMKYADGTPFDIFAFWYPTVKIPSETEPNVIDGFLTSTPTIIPGGTKPSFDKDKQFFMLSRPAVQATRIEKNSQGKLKTTYVETVIGVTFTYEDKYYPFYYDTGAVNSDAEFKFANEGVSSTFQRSELTYEQVGNFSYPLYAEMVYGAIIINDKTNNVTVINPEQLYVHKNDLLSLQTFCQQELAVKNRRRISYEITIPWLDTGYNVGDALTISGTADYVRDNYKITACSYNMPIDGDHSTSITIDNVVPPARSVTSVNSA